MLTANGYRVLMKTEAPSTSTTRLRRNRLWLAGGGAVAAAAIVAGFWVLNSGPGNAVARPEKVTRDTDGAFRPSETQWASLRLAPVRQVAFRDERATDGKIAINEDTTTPVFSPYSGRVTRLIAKPGDVVERGAPLFAIDASEFVQGQNDLVTAVAGVEKARSRLALAQTTEKRQRELLAIRGGALKDLEQAQSDLVGAQGDLRSAEIALAAVAQPAAHPRPLRRGDRASSRRSTASAPRSIVSAPIGGTIIQRKVGLGQYINVGATDPVFTVGDLSTVWLIANVREIGRAEDEGGRRRSRSRCWPSPAASSTPGSPTWRRRSIPTRAACRCAPRSRIPVASCCPRCSPLSASSRATSRLMPAVPQRRHRLRGRQGARLGRASRQKPSSRAPIEVGATTNGLVEVRKGLSVGETVVTSGTLFIDRAATRD